MSKTSPSRSALVPFLVCALVVAACSQPAQPPTEQESVPTEQEPEPGPQPKEWAIVIHGGAGVIPQDDGIDRSNYFDSLSQALALGSSMLRSGSASLEAVEAVVRYLEDDPLFNAGRGAVLTNRGTHELDAAIMDGRTLAAGAVAAVKNIRNPITLARRVLERSPHILLTGEGADEFAREVEVRRAPQDYFTTNARMRQWREVRRQASSDQGGSSGFGTVGAVALDRYGNLAAATSTGGLTNKRYGRVGDVPILGAGTYADNRTAAISCTGRGEEFIRHAVAHDIAARVAYKEISIQQATDEVIHGELEPGDGGAIAVDKTGEIAMVFNSKGMYRGAADSAGQFAVGIWEELRTLDPETIEAPVSGN